MVMVGRGGDGYEIIRNIFVILIWITLWRVCEKSVKRM